ncbi:hypothetical protein [Terracidiphilus sp.]|uniref:hypothetical protein n=1 Tax=Terracidiphilus sp. TaxID=1964191 RepID=UPI003C17D5EC
MKRIIVITLTAVLCGVTRQSPAAQTQIEVHACTEHGNTYDCDRHTFDQLLRTAKTISIQVPRLAAGTSKQLQQLAASLGKTVQPDSADLAFVLTSPDPSGVYFGPSDRKLATINVYYKASSSNPGQLIWSESYFGQPDTPWPTAAHAVIEQFRKSVKRP